MVDLKKRRAIGVKSRTYDRLKALCDREGTKVSTKVEQIVKEKLDKQSGIASRKFSTRDEEE